MNDIVKIKTIMSEYCKECNYQCCNICGYKDVAPDCNINTFCKAWPIQYNILDGDDSYLQAFGVLGTKNWEFEDTCNNNKITVIMNYLIKQLSTHTTIKGLSETLNLKNGIIKHEGIELEITKANPDEANKFRTGLYKTLKTFCIN